MRSIALGMAAATLLAGIAAAQTAGTATTARQGAPVIASGTPAGTAAASGNDNQAVATTQASALRPARGRNSFSHGEARRRLERHGFSNVSDLRKDGDGVWRGQASHAGAATGVWLDYKGNVGTSAP